MALTKVLITVKTYPTLSADDLHIGKLLKKNRRI